MDHLEEETATLIEQNILNSLKELVKSSSNTVASALEMYEKNIKSLEGLSPFVTDSLRKSYVQEYNICIKISQTGINSFIDKYSLCDKGIQKIDYSKLLAE